MPDSQSIQCPGCSEQIHLPSSNDHAEWHCPECGLAIPSVSGMKTESGDEEDTYQIRRPEPTKRQRRKPSQTYVDSREAPVESEDRGLEPPPMPLSNRELDGPLGLQRRERLKVETDPPPEQPFLTNVFGFPYDGSVVSYWLVVAGTFTFFAFLALLVQSMLLAAHSIVSAVVAFIALPAFWIGCWTFSFAAACFLNIVEETAAGNNAIREWMDNTWRDWMAQLFYLLYLACLPMAVAWPIVRLCGYTYSQAVIPLAITEFILFPILLLSALELDSAWFPVSAPIVESLFKVMGGWLKFYVLTGLIAGVCGGLVYFAMKEAHFGLALLIGPLFAWATFVYARLIGRLGWLITKRVRRKEVEIKASAVPMELE